MWTVEGSIWVGGTRPLTRDWEWVGFPAHSFIASPLQPFPGARGAGEAGPRHPAFFFASSSLLVVDFRLVTGPDKDTLRPRNRND